MKRCIRNKKGFTVVELVIVIAVVAILAAVLIPTFSSLIKNAKKSNDISTMRTMNKALLLEDAEGNKLNNLTQVKNVIINNGGEIPCKPETSNHKFYWIPSENKVVFYDLSENKVISPEEFITAEKTDSWVDLSYDESTPETPVESDESTTSSGTEPHDEPQDEPEEKPQEPEDEPDKNYTLLSGNDFNSKIKSLCSDPTKIVFGRQKDYSSKTSGTSQNVSSDGNIKAYLNGKEIYVLSKGNIISASSLSSAFSGMSSLTSIEFNNFDTSAATNMNNMFNGCTGLISLDISCFNTSKVEKTEQMFYDCKNLQNIYVNKSRWNVEKVSSSNSIYMFEKCTKLPNYQSSSQIVELPILRDIIGSIFPGTTNDVTYAHTGKGGYLTEK